MFMGQTSSTPQSVSAKTKRQTNHSTLQTLSVAIAIRKKNTKTSTSAAEYATTFSALTAMKPEEDLAGTS